MEKLLRHKIFGLRNKLLVALVLFAFVPMLILSALISEQAKRIVTESTAYLQNMRASVLSQEIDLHFNNNIHKQIYTISRDSRIYNMPGSKQLDRINGVRLTTKYGNTDPFWNLYLRTESGVNIIDANESPDTPAQWRPVIEESRNKNSVTYREFTEDQASTKRYDKCLFSMPVNGGKPDSTVYFTGIVKVDIDNIIYDLINQLDIKNLPVLVLDQNGVVVYSRNFDNLPNTQYIARNVNKTSDHWVEDKVGNEAYYFFGAPMKELEGESNLKWILFVGMPKNEITSDIKLSRNTILAVSIVCLIFLIGMGILFSTKIVDPILQIVQGTNEIRKGNFATRIAVETSDELQTLAEGYNQMANAIQDSLLKYKSQTQELDRRINEMRVLHDLGKSMNSMLELDELLNTIIICVVGGLKFDRAVLMLVDETKNWLSVNATIRSLQNEIKDLKIAIEKDSGIIANCALTGDEALVMNAETDPRVKNVDRFLKSRTFFVTALVANDNVIGILIVDNKLTNNPLTHENVGTLTTFANSAALAIHNAVLYKSLGEKERLEQELRIGMQIQTGLLPKDFPIVTGLNVVGKMIPAREIGGDYFDFISNNGDGLGIVIGDVAGKGVPAGLIMAMARSIIRSVALTTHSGKQILAELNRLLTSDMEDFRFMTMLYMNWLPDEGKIRYSSAGHEHVIVFRAKTQDCEVVRLKGVAIGLTADISDLLAERDIELSPNDAIVLYTDGVTEAVNPKNEQYKLQRLLDSTMRHGQLNAAEMLNELIGDLKRFIGTALPYDDVTLVVLKRTNT